MMTLLKKTQFVLLICIAVSLPFVIGEVQLNSFFILLYVAASIPIVSLSRDKKNRTFKGAFILLISFYLLHVIGLAKTTILGNGMFELEKKLSLLVFPLILFYGPKFKISEVKIILLGFAGSCTAVGIFCLFGASYYLITENNSTYFFYHSLSGIAGMHAIYLSMYFCFSIFILLYYFLDDTIPLKPKYRIICYCCITFLAVLIILLAGRMQILFLVSGAALYFIFNFNKSGKKIRAIVKGVSIGLFISVIVLLIPVNRNRFKEAINYHADYSINKQWGGRALRELNWSSALELIKLHPLTGVGTGDVQDELDNVYKAHNYVPLLFWKNSRYNAHNQFLETAVALGIPGLLLLLSGFLFCMYYSLKFHNLLYFMFLLLFIFSCLTESMLERQNGVVFYALFNSLFLFHSLNNKVTPVHSE